MKSDIYYNATNDPIVIVTKWEADPLGGPAIQQETIILAKGEGIDLETIGLKKRVPFKE